LTPDISRNRCWRYARSPPQFLRECFLGSFSGEAARPSTPDAIGMLFTLFPSLRGFLGSIRRHSFPGRADKTLTFLFCCSFLSPTTSVLALYGGTLLQIFSFQLFLFLGFVPCRGLPVSFGKARQPSPRVSRPPWATYRCCDFRPGLPSFAILRRMQNSTAPAAATLPLVFSPVWFPLFSECGRIILLLVPPPR